MKNRFLRIFAAFLLAAMLISAASCTGSIPEETTELITESTTEAPVAPVEFKITEDYVLLRADEAEDEEIRALQMISRGIKSAYGFSCSMLTDFKRESDEVKPAEFEILIGKTNRAESVTAAKELAYYDWKYEIVSENVIVICGGSPEATLTAVKEFLKDMLGYEEESHDSVISAGNAATLMTQSIKSYRHNYPVTSLKLGDRDIKEYSIVVKSDNKVAAETLLGGISRLCGFGISSIPFEEYKGGPAIFLGCGDVNGQHVDVPYFGSARYYITESDGNYFIDYKSKNIAKIAAERFVDELFPADAKGDFVAKLESGKTLTGLNITSGTNGLVFESSKSTEIADGIVYEEILYLDKDGKPVRAYALTIKHGAATIQTTMPSDDVSKVGKVSNMKNQLTSAKSNGKKVIAGINADFFDMGGTNIMRGLCIKDGQVLHGTDDRPWFAITKEGDAVMGVWSDYANYKDKLQHAVGGSHILLKHDGISNLGIGTEFGDTRHPRTAVGVLPDGSIVFLVVDGRQPEISNGASLADLAQIFGRFGCIDAINLDGGGSSTFIIDEKGSFVTKNSPSAGSLRAVANGLMVVLP